MHPLAERARTAYAVGWASSGGPLTDRVRAGCAVAVTLACEHADDPHILEATLQLGSLEGTWAAVYARRNAVYDAKQAAVMAAVRALLSGLDLEPAIDQFRAAAGITESDQADRVERDRRTAEAVAAVAAVLLAALGNHDDPDYQTLLTTMVNTLRDAQAEGVAGAIAIAAEQTGLVGIDFDRAFADARAELAAVDYLEADATAWMKTIVDGVARDVGRTVVDLAAGDATKDVLLAGAEDLIADGELPSVTLLVDEAVSKAFARGGLGLYTRNGARTVDLMTAGDGRVCKRCRDAEAHGPYAILDAPVPSLHPWCRCVLVPHDPLDALSFAAYAMGG